MTTLITTICIAIILTLVFSLNFLALKDEVEFLKKKVKIPDGELERTDLINDVIYGKPSGRDYFHCILRENPLFERVELLEEKILKLEKHLKIKYTQRETIASYSKKK